MRRSRKKKKAMMMGMMMMGMMIAAATRTLLNPIRRMMTVVVAMMVMKKLKTASPDTSVNAFNASHATKPRLSSLGLQKVSEDIKRSRDEEKKKQQKRNNRQPAIIAGPRRQQPGRSARAATIAEQSEKVAKKATTTTASTPKPKKVKKNSNACWTCQEITGKLHICDFCRKLYHSTCDTNLNKEDYAARDDDFKCTICEKEGKNRRVPCGLCEGCLRESDCETCVYCRRKMEADEEASVRQKCIFRKCRNWGMGATVTIGEDGEVVNGEDDEEDIDDVHDAECNVCHTGGDLICCDGCPFVFHSDCHKPKISSLPDGEWFCMHCSKKPKAPKEKKSKYRGPLSADLGDREVTCVVQFPKLECIVCEGTEVTGAKKELDWTTCKVCDDSFHLQCLEPPLETRPNSFKCPSCKENKRKGVPKEKKSKPLFEGVHDDDCYICRNGGNLVCCDFCEKVSNTHFIVFCFCPNSNALNTTLLLSTGFPLRMPYTKTTRHSHYLYLEVLRMCCLRIQTENSDVGSAMPVR